MGRRRGSDHHGIRLFASHHLIKVYIGMGFYPVLPEFRRGLEAGRLSGSQHRGDVCTLLMEILSNILADPISPSTRSDDRDSQPNQKPSPFPESNEKHFYFNIVNGTLKYP
jgi:hypothetical protein